MTRRFVACGAHIARGAAVVHDKRCASFWLSTLPFMMDWEVVSWMSLASFPLKLGRKASKATGMTLLKQRCVIWQLVSVSVGALGCLLNLVQKSKAI